MGFLDRMAADFVADSTGLPVRSLVRRVGVSRLLLMGGAVAAGGAAVSAMSNRNQRARSKPQALPPLPPTPSRSANPPLPAIPQTADLPPIPTAPGVQQDPDPDTAFALIRAMIGAALADGILDPREKSAILEHLGDAGLSDAQREQIHRDLVLPPSPHEIAALCPDDAGISVYRAAVLVTMTDQQLSDLEQRYLERLAQALGMPDNLGAEIRDEMLGAMNS